MKKYSVCVIFFIIEFIIIIFLGVNILSHLVEISNLQQQKEYLLEEHTNLQSDFVEVNQQMEELRAENEKLTGQLADQKRVVPEGWQPFYGFWLANIYYTADKEKGQECSKYIRIQHNYIKITGKNNLTDEPVFDIAVRIRGDVINEIKAVGVGDEDLINMLQAECYAEIDFNSIYNWKRELLPGEVDLIENAKYYILDNQTMLCISQNDGGKVYVFTRSSY